MARVDKHRTPPVNKMSRDWMSIVLMVAIVFGLLGVVGIDEIAGKIFFGVIGIAALLLFIRRTSKKRTEHYKTNHQADHVSQVSSTPVTPYNLQNPINASVSPELPFRISLKQTSDYGTKETVIHSPSFFPSTETAPQVAQKTETTRPTSQLEKPQTPPMSAMQSNQIALPPQSWGMPLAYQYIDKVCIDPNNPPLLDLITIGDEITFQQEPQNPYDNRAVIIQTKKQKLGYVYKSNIQDMINDFKAKDLMVLGYIYDIYPHDYTIKYLIGFYCFKRPKGKVLGRGKLISNRSKDAQENISYCKRYEPLSIEPDEDKPTYKVLADGVFVGKLPKGMIDFVDYATFFVDDIEEAEDGKCHITVAAYQLDEPAIQ